MVIKTIHALGQPDVGSKPNSPTSELCGIVQLASFLLSLFPLPCNGLLQRFNDMVSTKILPGALLRGMLHQRELQCLLCSITEAKKEVRPGSQPAPGWNPCPVAPSDVIWGKWLNFSQPPFLHL